MFRAGGVTTTVCPSRVLEDAPWAVEFVDWWLLCAKWGEMTGAPIGMREWPFPGGALRQPAPIIRACQVLLAEFAEVKRAGQQDGEGSSR